MLKFIIAMYPPNRPVEFYPKGYGFTSHRHTLNQNEAEAFDSPEKASMRMNAYRWPTAFWESERIHAKQQIAKFKDWRFEVQTVSSKEES